ncbi:MAG: DUF58 domain-containing protein [Candidatus Nanohaloarchaea archaeon]
MPDKPFDLNLKEEVDSEVKEINEVFRFVLKYLEEFQPSGVEFSELRKYRSGDDASRIDWKSSNRLNDIYVKEFDEIRDLDVFIVLDASSTMTFGTSDKLKSEYAAVLAAAMSYASADNGLKVGIGIFGGEETFITPSSGLKQYRKILNEVSDPGNYGGSFDLKSAIDKTVNNIKSKSYLFVLSDFIETGEGWSDRVKMASSKFENVLCIMVRDLRDYKLPDAGNVRLGSPNSSGQQVVNTSRIREDFEERVEKQEEKVRKKVIGAGADFLKIDTRESPGAALLSFFDERGALQ